MTSVEARENSVSKSSGHINLSNNMEGLNKHFCKSLKMIAQKRQQLDREV